MSACGPRTGVYRGTTSEMRQVIRFAEENGWRVEITKSQHIAFRKPQRSPVFASFTGRPSSARKTLARLRRVDRCVN